MVCEVSDRSAPGQSIAKGYLLTGRHGLLNKSIRCTSASTVSTCRRFGTGSGQKNDRAKEYWVATSIAAGGGGSLYSMPFHERDDARATFDVVGVTI